MNRMSLRSSHVRHVVRVGSIAVVAALAAAGGCSDDDGGDDTPTAGSGGTMSTNAGSAGTMSTNAGSGGSTMTGGPPASAHGVEFPTGFEDWATIGFSRRLDNGQMRVVVGNTTAVDAARAALPGRPSDWPEGSILVDIVWAETDNPEWDEMVGPGAFAAIAVMEKGSTAYADTGAWGYGFWNASLEAGGNLGDATTGADTSTCFGCHNTRVPDQDFVFTQPLPFPSDTLVAGAATAANGLELPADVTRWRVLSAHHRTDNNQLRLVLGNDTAVDAWRAGTVDPDWPDGTMLADILFASETLEASATPNETNMVAPTTWAAIAFMERDPQGQADTDDWGYAAFNLANDSIAVAASSSAADASDPATCYGCHLAEVPDRDYVFTVPGGLPADLP